MRHLILLLLLALPVKAQEFFFYLLPAKSVSITPVPVLRDWQRQTVAACLVLEAACQGEAGMRAVMAVVRNRAQQSPTRFASEVMRPQQFSAFNKVTSGVETFWKAVLRAQRDQYWSLAEQIVQEACAVEWVDPTGGATHYTRASERPYWARDMRVTVRIGDHVFYKL